MDNMSSKQEKNSAYSNPYVTQLPKLSKSTDSPANEKANVQNEAVNDKQIHDDEQEAKQSTTANTHASGDDNSLSHPLEQTESYSQKMANNTIDSHKKPPRREDLIDIPLQPRPQPPVGSTIDGSSPQAVASQQQVKQQEAMAGERANPDVPEDAPGPYSFLKFPMVEDENATDESGNNRSGDEAGNAGVVRRVAEDNYSSKVGPGFGRRKSSQNSHLSKGSGQNSKKGSLKNAAMVNNFFHPSAHQPMPNPVVSSVMKQQGWDKMKNLKSVLDSRKHAKGTSGTRAAAKARRPSGEPGSVNIQNQKARKNSQEGKNRPPSQSSKNSGKAGGKPRPPVQNQAKQRANPMITLTGGGLKASKRQGLTKKQVSEPSSKSNVSDSERGRDQAGLEQPDNEYLETMKLRMRGLPDLKKGPASAQAAPAQGYEQLDSMDTQEIINRANDAILAKKAQTVQSGTSSQPRDKEKLQGSAGGKGYSLRALKRKEDADKKRDMEANAASASLYGNMISRVDSIGQSKSLATLPQDEENDEAAQMIDEMFGNVDDDRQVLDAENSGSGLNQRKPKFLMSKLSNLMRDTKSSANRNRGRGQVASLFGQTINVGGPGQNFLASDDQPQSLRKSPSKIGAKPHSPKRRQQSPLAKSKAGLARSTQNLQGIINLKSTPTKFDQINEIMADGDDYLEQIKERRNMAAGSKSMKLTYYEQVPSGNEDDGEEEGNRVAEPVARTADIPPTDSPTQITLEGISGMVVMDSKAVGVSNGKEEDEDQKHGRETDEMLPYDEDDIRKGESGGASSSSSSDRLNVTDGQEADLLAEDEAGERGNQQRQPNSLKPPLDLDSIRIDEKELAEISKSSREQQERRTSKNNEFNSELMTIIGSINSRAKELKTKFSMKAQAAKQPEEAGALATGEAVASGELAIDQAQSIQMSDMNRESLSYSQRSKRAITNRTGGHRRMLTEDRSSANAEDEEDPLKAVALDLSSEANDLDEKSINDNIPKKYSNLDQTIIIGEMEEGNIFDDLRMSKSATEVGDKASDVTRQISQFTDQEFERLKDKNDDNKAITISIEDLQELVDNMRLKHRAEIDAIVMEQGAYKRIIQGLILKLKQQQAVNNQQDLKILGLRKFELESQKLSEYNAKLQSEVEFYRNEVDKFKIALIEYDRHVRDKVLSDNEFHIQQLETENAHLRKLLNIPDELFKVDPEEEKKKEADKKRGMLKSIDEKLKAAEKKIAKKQTAQELYYQQQKQHGFDPFELDQEEYDLYRLNKLKDHGDMPKDMKNQLQNKIYGKMEERSYREELRRHQEKEILQEFARVYGYDVNKHQPHPNNGEIDVEYLQAYIAECRQKEEKLAEKIEAEKALAKQKEALKGKVAAVTKPKQASTNNTGTKSSTPSVKKQLTVETEHGLVAGPGSSGSGSGSATPDSSEPSSESSVAAKEDKKEEVAVATSSTEGKDKDKESVADDLAASDQPRDQKASASTESSMAGESTGQDSPAKGELEAGDDEQFDRDDGGDGRPMTREELEEGSSDSAAALARGLKPSSASEDGTDEPIAHHEEMSATLSQQSLQEMLRGVEGRDEPVTETDSSPEIAGDRRDNKQDGDPDTTGQPDAGAEETNEGPDTGDGPKNEPENAQIISVKKEESDDRQDMKDEPEQKEGADTEEPEADSEQFDPYSSSLSQTFKAGQKNEALDFGQLKQCDDNLQDDEEEDDPSRPDQPDTREEKDNTEKQ